MPVSHAITVNYAENPAILGKLADADASRLAIPTYAEFCHQRLTSVFPPRRPIASICDDDDEAKQQVFAMVNQERNIAHQKDLVQYEKKRHQYDLLNTYSGDWAGYGAYLWQHFPQVKKCFGTKRVFPIDEESRRLHSYITGGSGSGKSECLKSLVWHYLTEDTSSALIFLDPHNDVAMQVAQFRPNRDNGRLVYIEPAISDTLFPGLNPFDIDGKEHLSDKQAEDYASEFIHAFDEILDEDDLSIHMRTLLKNTIPVVVKMPDTSIYDLIDFLQPKPKGQSGQSGQPQDAYPAQRYLDFAKAHFTNRQMLKFLAGQFDQDMDFVKTRNSLTTRLQGIFGSTQMQALFRGKRTVRLEALIRQRKFVVFNLSELGQDDTGPIGRFILITLKIFALNQAKIPKSKRTPCHVFVDECQKFLTESMRDILQEARKFYVYLTLAQQGAGQHPMKAPLFEAIRTNCAIKMAGANSGNSLDIMSKETGVSAEAIADFGKGQFAIFQREAAQKIAVVRMPANTLDDSARMEHADWEAILSEQMRLYYREPELAEPESTPDVLHADIDAYRN